MNIALLDLNHKTMGIHTNTVPLGIGLIAHYLKNNMADRLDTKLFKDHDNFLRALEAWVPDVLGLAQYAWNSQLNLHIAQLVKKHNPACLVVAGGPNLYLSKEEKIAYLKEHDVVDICVSYDGEMPFTEIVRRRMQGDGIGDFRASPPAGTYLIDDRGRELIESSDLPPRLNSLDGFGPMYAEGFFDDLLDQGFHPFLQTQRGCPFRCAYCHAQDSYYSDVIFQSPQHFRRDLEYLGKRFAGQHNVILYVANTNFGLFKEDFEIASVIREIQDKYDWPKNININSANKPEKVLKILSMLKYKFLPVVSLQTLTPKVLSNINRKNMPLEEFVSFQKEMIKNIGRITATELILSLPEETKESFIGTLIRVLNSGVQNIVIFTLMALRGTPLACAAAAKRYGHVIRHRIVPRCFSTINGVKIFETEEVVAGTKSLPFSDYMSLRGVALIISVFASSIEMFPIRKFLMEKNFDIAEWIFGIQNAILDYRDLNSVYKSFLRETEGELFSTRQDLVIFFNDPQNYNLLSDGKFGDNLLRKYKTIFLSGHYAACLEAAISQLCRMIQKQTGNKQKSLESSLDDLNVYLRSRDIAYIFKNGYDKKAPEKIMLHYDIPKWLTQQDDVASLEDYTGVFLYSIQITDYMRNRLKDFKQANRNPELSLQILYRDGYIQDFWPQWVSDDIKQ